MAVSGQKKASQLALVSRLVTPPKPEPPAPTYVPVSSLRAKCDPPFIGSEDGRDRWLVALRFVGAEDLKKGNRINL